MEPSINSIRPLVSHLKDLIFSPIISDNIHHKEFLKDEDFRKLCLVDHVTKLGLAEHFTPEIDELLAQVYRKQYNSDMKEAENMATKLFKDALAFRLLRMQGHDVSPGSFCWFLFEEEEMLKRMESSENKQQLICAMSAVYDATEFLFPEESEFEEARKISRRFLESNSHYMIVKPELDDPWIARVDHVSHRNYIDHLLQTQPCHFRSIGLSSIDSNKLLQLAISNFELRQSTFLHELQQLKRWCKKWRLGEMGFEREKTLHLYFAVASSNCHISDSVKRLAMAKTAMMIVVGDDFYDVEGSLFECQALTDAFQSWDDRELCGHGKMLFAAFDDLVNYIASNFYPQQRGEAVAKLRNIWYETLRAWMLEKTWSLTGHTPSREEYLENAMTSVAVQTGFLPFTSFMRQAPQCATLEPKTYPSITRLVMVISRLLNDIQSYQREREEAKMNLVMLHMNENPNSSIEDSIAYLKTMLDAKKKEFLKLVFKDDNGNMDKSSKQVHVSWTKLFYMFYNSGNKFDSDTALLDDINKAIYLPIARDPKSDPSFQQSPLLLPLKRQKSKVYMKSVSTPSCQIMEFPGLAKFPPGKNLLGGKTAATTYYTPITYKLCFL